MVAPLGSLLRPDAAIARFPATTIDQRLGSSAAYRHNWANRTLSNTAGWIRQGRPPWVSGRCGVWKYSRSSVAPAAPLLMSTSLRANAGLRSSRGLVPLTGTGLAAAAAVRPRTRAVIVKPFIGQPPYFRQDNCRRSASFPPTQ